jgi:hypothetical protein
MTSSFLEIIMTRTMRRLVVALSLSVISSAPRLAAQTPPEYLLPSLVANPKDVSSVDAIIAALYDANTIMVDQKRDTARFRTLFVPSARLLPAAHVGGRTLLTSMTVDDYIHAASSGQPRGGFSEREIARTSESFGAITQVFSTYQTRRNANDQNPSRGINSIQLFNDGTRWWVVTVMWDNERPDNPIPPTYLKTPGKAEKMP